MARKNTRNNTRERDPESNQSAPAAQSQSQSGLQNPYQEQQPEVLPLYHPLNILKRALYILVAGYGLHKLKAAKAIFVSPHIRHEWFKIGLAGTVAIMAIKAYVELYAGKLQRRTVNYENFRQTTHAVMILILLTSLAFHVALWPHYGTNTFVVLFLVGVILLQLALLLPTYLQNAICVVFMTFFLQEYK